MSSFSHITILGRQPELGLVELESLLGADAVQPFGRQAALISGPVDVNHLGGSLKVAEIIYRGNVTALRELPIDVAALPISGSKTPFALSAYGVRETPQMLRAAGLELKKQLKLRGSVRLIMAARGFEVTAAELRHNNVLDDGFELLVIASKGEMIVARTIGVQDIDWYSKRDYERPARSAKVGMLPPKLAQILVNTTRGSMVVDLFCGTGVVLQEALLMGRPAEGSDVSGEMVDATKTNMQWLQDEVGASMPTYRVQKADARDAKLPENSAIVSEGYLGPNLSHAPTPPELASMKRDLRSLYTSCLSNWARQLPSGAEISLCAPAWRLRGAWSYLGLVDELPRLGYTLKSFEHVRTPLLYARDDQVVGRQLLLLRKI